MLIVISPAKKLNEDILTDIELTKPVFETTSKKLHQVLKSKSSNEIKKLMGLSDNLADLNYNRFQRMKFPQKEKDLSPAGLIFNGDTYTGLQFDQFNKSQQKYAQKHLRILSGLYGLLKPFDGIQPYRLEMGTKLKTELGKDLYSVWKEKITKNINDELKNHKALINLASNEYFDSVDKKLINKEIITPVFKENKNGVLKIISFNAKRARGMMSQYIIKNKISSPDGLLNFDMDGYKYSAENSKENFPTFIR